MEVLGVYKLCGDGITGTSGTQLCVLLGVLGVGITGLNHEVAYYAVEQDAVVVVLLYQLYEIVPVLGCLIVEFDSYIT